MAPSAPPEPTAAVKTTGERLNEWKSPPSCPDFLLFDAKLSPHQSFDDFLSRIGMFTQTYIQTLKVLLKVPLKVLLTATGGSTRAFGAAVCWNRSSHLLFLDVRLSG